jgi:hypothetical protein
MEIGLDFVDLACVLTYLSWKIDLDTLLVIYFSVQLRFVSFSTAELGHSRSIVFSFYPVA